MTLATCSAAPETQSACSAAIAALLSRSEWLVSGISGVQGGADNVQFVSPLNNGDATSWVSSLRLVVPVALGTVHADLSGALQDSSRVWATAQLRVTVMADLDVVSTGLESLRTREDIDAKFTAGPRKHVRQRDAWSHVRTCARLKRFGLPNVSVLSRVSAGCDIRASRIRRWVEQDVRSAAARRDRFQCRRRSVQQHMTFGV